MNINLHAQTVQRFFLAGFTGALSAATTITIFEGITSWKQFYTAFNYLILCLIVGFINGIIQALHKYYISGATVSTDLVTEMPEALTE